MVDAELDRCDFEDDELGDDELVLGEYDMRRVQRRRTFPLSYSPRTGAAPHQGRLFLFRRGGMLLRQLFQHPLQDRSPFFLDTLTVPPRCLPRRLARSGLTAWRWGRLPSMSMTRLPPVQVWRGGTRRCPTRLG